MFWSLGALDLGPWAPGPSGVSHELVKNGEKNWVGTNVEALSFT